MALNDTRLQAGKLRQRIEIVQPSTSRDSMGGTTPGGGSSLGVVWASVETLSGRDALAAQAFTAVVTHRVTIRYMPGVLAKQQVIFGSRKFQIEAVTNPDERTKKLVLLCVEINDSQQQ
jgi:SPP1 family predicted phage head-tail adaptor